MDIKSYKVPHETEIIVKFLGITVYKKKEKSEISININDFKSLIYEDLKKDLNNEVSTEILKRLNTLRA